MEHSTSGRAAAQVAAEMARQQMSLRTLSDTTGIPLTTLHRTMRSGRSLSLIELDLIAAALNVEPAALIVTAGDAA